MIPRVYLTCLPRVGSIVKAAQQVRGKVAAVVSLKKTRQAGRKLVSHLATCVGLSLVQTMQQSYDKALID